MRKHNVIAIDLAKHSFHVTVLNKHDEFVVDRPFSRTALTRWLARQPESMVAIEACGSAHHWARTCASMGHQPRILAPKSVKPYREGHKPDQKDARAIATAACRPDVHSVAIKSLEQQGLQAMERIRQHWVDHVTATSNLIRSLLYEFNLIIPTGYAALQRSIPRILEDAENDLPGPFRHQLAALYQAFKDSREELSAVEQSLFALVRQHPACRRLLQLEGVGPVTALGLYLTLGDKGASFQHGREAAACIGVTPKQWSTGGVVTMGGIGRLTGKGRFRANLIQGALSVVSAQSRRAPRTGKEVWLQGLIGRSGKRRAAVALANKTVRTAWAMLHNDESYRAPQALAA
jgi:transposase